LSLEQYQTVGALFINELKNILITIFSAKLVIEGQLTLGMMLSVSYIIGQLNTPLLQMIEFLHSSQNAKLSLERLMEISRREDEESKNQNKINNSYNSNKINCLL
jgi:ATP-binding cassette subfamily B protein